MAARAQRTAFDSLSKRERQVMEIIFRRGTATVAEVFRELPDPASYNAVRSIMNVLEEKGHLRHDVRGRSFVYSPVVKPNTARRSLLAHVLSTIFSGSPEQLVNTLVRDTRTSDEELERLESLIRAERRARRRARK